MFGNVKWLSQKPNKKVSEQAKLYSNVMEGERRAAVLFMAVRTNELQVMAMIIKAALRAQLTMTSISGWAELSLNDSFFNGCCCSSCFSQA